MSRTAVFHASFDPPTLYHRQAVEALRQRFERVVVCPCGPRPNRQGVPDSRPVHRATMADLNFRGIPDVEVDLSDLEHARFSTHHALADRYAAAGVDLWHVISTDWVRGGEAGGAIVQADWDRGREMWTKSGFAILKERHEPLDLADLPPRHEIVETPSHLTSSAVRMMLNQGEQLPDGALHPPVEAYISRHQLFRDVPMLEKAHFRPTAPRFRVEHDPMNERAKNHMHFLKSFDGGDPEVIVAIGGDGTMLRAIRRNWRDRLPFFGINTGGLGFLLNGRELTPFWERELTVYHLPLLRVETEFVDGSKAEGYAFNDAWVERASGQTAWVRVSVNGVERVPRLIGDGVLLATAAGSSSYARAMGATPAPLNTDVLILVGSNVLKPTFWRPVVLPHDAEVTFENVDTVRRPLTGVLDGEPYPLPIRSMKIRVSRTAAAELVFVPEHDPVAKLGFVQFPKESD